MSAPAASGDPGLGVVPGEVLAGKYRLVRSFAQGGMGAVWIAQHVALDTQVAVKLLSPSYVDSTGDARVRFEREAKAAAGLRSQHVVQVHDFGVHGEIPYIVMELLEGEDLGARLKRVRNLSLVDTAAVLLPVCKALGAAHEAGLIHRDLKPANVYLARFGRDEVVKVLDFGIAKSLNPGAAGEATKSDVLMGSPHYMSPEQVRGRRDIDRRSDIWALGVIAFKCLFGRVPFPGQEVGDVFVAICSDPVPVPSVVAPGAPPALDAFFARALERDPARRFQTADDFAAALGAVSASGILVAPPPPHSAPGDPTSVTGDRSALGLSTQTGPATGRTISPPPRRRGLAIGVGALIGAAGVGAALAILAPRTSHESAATPTADGDVRPAAAPASATAPEVAPATASAVVSAVLPAAESASARPTSTPPPTPPASSARPESKPAKTPRRPPPAAGKPPSAGFDPLREM